MARKKKHREKRTHRQTRLESQEHKGPSCLAILETLGVGGLLILGYMLQLSPVHKIAATWVFFAAWVAVGLIVAIRLTQEYSVPTPLNELDNPSWAALNVSKASSPHESLVPTETPRVTETPVATPSAATIVTPAPIAHTTPTPTPEPTAEAPYVTNDPNEVARKLQEAKNHGTSKQIREALVNMLVDWKLLFWQAEYTSDKTQVSAFFIWRSSADATTTDLMASFELPIKGHERLPLRDKYFEFRVEGIIDEVSGLDVVHLKEVRITPNQ